MSGKEHTLRVTYAQGWLVEVDCPHEALGDKRPCAVWADGNADTRLDGYTFQQYADACFVEDWLHGQIKFAPVAITQVG